MESLIVSDVTITFPVATDNVAAVPLVEEFNVALFKLNAVHVVVVDAGNVSIVLETELVTFAKVFAPETVKIPAPPRFNVG